MAHRTVAIRAFVLGFCKGLGGRIRQTSDAAVEAERRTQGASGPAWAAFWSDQKLSRERRRCIGREAI